MQFVMRFPDGKYEAAGMKSKLPFHYREKYEAYNERNKHLVELGKVTELNQARVYVSEKSCQSGNAWGWGARPVPVRIELV